MSTTTEHEIDGWIVIKQCSDQDPAADTGMDTTPSESYLWDSKGAALLQQGISGNADGTAVTDAGSVRCDTHASMTRKNDKDATRLQREELSGNYGDSDEGALPLKHKVPDYEDFESDISKTYPYTVHVILGDKKVQPTEVDSVGEGALSLKQRMVNISEVKEQGGRRVYQLNTRTQNNQLSNSSDSEHECEEPSKVVLLVGATGAGKTTLINSLINYAFGVEMEDDFRFQLIPDDPTRNQSQSQTECVSSYTLPHQEGSKIPYTLTIIDTPGFGDTAGIARDEKTIGQIRECFRSDPPIVDHIDAVGFVVCSTETRLSATQKYIFHSVLSLFGKDTAENIVLLFTFCDSMPPAILPALKAANIPCTKDKMFKFNNSAILEINEREFGEDEEEDSNGFNELFWKYGMKNFESFMEALSKLPPNYLEMTNEVLDLRRKLEYSGALPQQVDAHIMKLLESEDYIKKLKVKLGSAKNQQECLNNVKGDQSQKMEILQRLWNKLTSFLSKYSKVIKTASYVSPPKDIPTKPSHGSDKVLDDSDTFLETELVRESRAMDFVRKIVMFLLLQIQQVRTELGQKALKKPETRTIVDYIEEMIQRADKPSESERKRYVQYLKRFRDCSKELMKLKNNVDTRNIDLFEEFSLVALRDSVDGTATITMHEEVSSVWNRYMASDFAEITRQSHTSVTHEVASNQDATTLQQEVSGDADVVSVTSETHASVTQQEGSNKNTTPLKQASSADADVVSVTSDAHTNMIQEGGSDKHATSLQQLLLVDENAETDSGKAYSYTAHVILGDNKLQPSVGSLGGDGVLSLKQRMVKNLVKMQDGRSIYQLNTRTQNNQPFDSSDFEEIKHDEPSKVVLLVGATGAGKTTLINSLINYAFGVEITDDFRFQLISDDPSRNQSQSQTECVSSYTLPHQEGSKIPYTLTIIDTPGFGDTGGIARDEKTIGQIRECFRSDPPIVDHIDAVGFVVNSTETKLSTTQKYIFHSVLSLFGKDIAENIILLFTFCDCMSPAILPVLKAAHIPFTKDKMFKFNNSAILEINEREFGEDEEDSDGFNEIFWRFGMVNFERFIDALNKLSAKDLEMTNDVLNLRHITEYSKALQRSVIDDISLLLTLENRGNTLKNSGGVGKNNETLPDVSVEDQSQESSYYYVAHVLFEQWKRLKKMAGIYSETFQNTHQEATQKSEKTTEEEEHNKTLQGLRDAMNLTRKTVMGLLLRLHDVMTELAKIALKPDRRTIVDYIDGVILQIETQTESEWMQYIQHVQNSRKSSQKPHAIELCRQQYIQHLQTFRNCSKELLDKAKTGHFNLLEEFSLAKAHYSVCGGGDSLNKEISEIWYRHMTTNF